MTDQRPLLRAIFDAAVAAAHPDIVLPAHLRPVPKGRVICLAAGKAAAAMADAPPPEFKITPGTKPVMNDPGVVAATAKVLQAAFGDKLRATPPVSASEDFSEYAAAGVPSMMFNIGAYEPERVAAARNGTGPQLAPNHSPLFAPVPQPTITLGVQAMTLAVLSAFDQRATGQ